MGKQERVTWRPTEEQGEWAKREKVGVYSPSKYSESPSATDTQTFLQGVLKRFVKSTNPRDLEEKGSSIRGFASHGGLRGESSVMAD